MRSEIKFLGFLVKSSFKFEEEFEKKIDFEFYEDILEFWVYIYKNWGSLIFYLVKCWKLIFNYIFDICM